MRCTRYSRFLRKKERGDSDTTEMGESMLTALASLLTLASSLAGLWAARLWWSASRLPIPERIPPFVSGRSTGDPQAEMLGEIVATISALHALSESTRGDARLNAQASLYGRVRSRLPCRRRPVVGGDLARCGMIGRNTSP